MATVSSVNPARAHHRRVHSSGAILKGQVAWFARNPVAANLMMVFIIMSGVFATQAITEEVFPKIELDRVSITVPYLGAAPEEVESGVILRIEAFRA